MNEKVIAALLARIDLLERLVLKIWERENESLQSDTFHEAAQLGQRIQSEGRRDVLDVPMSAHLDAARELLERCKE